MRRMLCSIFACSVALTSYGMAETPIQSHASILAAIQTFVESNFRHSKESHDVEIAPLDHRLHLAECSQPIEVFSLPGSREFGNISLGVRCQGSQPWTLYHKANVRLYKEVTVLKNPVRQGAIITPGDIMLERKDVALLRGVYLTPERAIDQPIKKSLPAGTVLTPDHLTTLKLIKRGQKVDIRAQSANFEVSMSGVALMDGEQGQRIRVRNEQSKRIVEGTVTSEGVINITH